MDRCISVVSYIIASCSIFLLLMLFSHGLLANDQVLEKANLDEQVLVAVFEDHSAQMNSSMPYGLSWALIERAAEQQKLDLVKVATTWQSGINRLKDDRLDLMFAAFKTEKRQEWAMFSLPLASDTSALFSAIDSPVNSFEEVDFENEVVGVVSNSTQETLAREIGFKTIYPAKVRMRLYKILQSGRIDYVLTGTSIARYCETDAPCLQQVGEALANDYTRMMALKSSPRSRDLMKSLNAGLLAIYNQPETLQLFLEHDYSQSYYENWKTHFENEMLAPGNLALQR